MSQQAEGRRIAGVFERAGIPLLVLKGPELQQRLYGTPARYPSSDIDILVPRGHAKRSRAILIRDGWRFESDNGVLWRWSAAASFARNGVRLDLHWGIHAAHLPAVSLRGVERALWARAERGPSGLLEPDPESLFVFLAVHAAGHDFERESWTENARAASRLVADWGRVWRVARDARVTGAVKAVLAGADRRRPVRVVDGVRGRLLWVATAVARGHFVPRQGRDWIRGSIRRGGRRVDQRAGRRITWFAGLPIRVSPGVFPPRAISEQLVTATLGAIEDAVSPLIVEVGTGSGAVALALASRRPDARVVATDISPRAVRCARANARRMGLSVTVDVGNLLEGIDPSARGAVAAIVANVPYVPAWLASADPSRYPPGTVVGEGNDGLDLVRRLAADARGYLVHGGALVIQVGDWQWAEATEALTDLGYEVVGPIERRPRRAVVGVARAMGRGA